MAYLPPYMIDTNGAFRMRERKALYIKVHNFATMDVQMQSPEGKAYVETRPACHCRTTGGKILILDFYLLVEQA